MWQKWQIPTPEVSSLRNSQRQFKNKIIIDQKK